MWVWMEKPAMCDITSSLFSPFFLVPCFCSLPFHIFQIIPFFFLILTSAQRLTRSFFFFSIFLLSNGNSHTGSQRAGTNFTGLFITMDLTCQSFECLSGNWRFERTEVVMKTGIIGRRSDVRLNVIFMKKLHPRSSVQWHLRENNQRRNVFIADLKVHLWFWTFFDWWEHWLFEDDGTMEKKRRTSWKEQKIKRKKKGEEEEERNRKKYMSKKEKEEEYVEGEEDKKGMLK